MPLEFGDIIILYQRDLTRISAAFGENAARAYEAGQFQRGHDLLGKVLAIDNIIRNMGDFHNVITRAYQNAGIPHIPGLNEDATSLVYHGEVPVQQKTVKDGTGVITQTEMGDSNNRTPMLSHEASQEQSDLEEDSTAGRHRSS